MATAAGDRQATHARVRGRRQNAAEGQAQQNTGEGPASDADAAHAAGGEDVVDAEFEEVDGDDHKKSA